MIFISVEYRVDWDTVVVVFGTDIGMIGPCPLERSVCCRIVGRRGMTVISWDISVGGKIEVAQKSDIMIMKL